MSATPFNDDRSIDEDGFQGHIARIAASGAGIYIGSGGAGEGHALSLQEFQRLCELGVEACKGVVPVYACPHEARSASDMAEYARTAFAAGVDRVQLYQVDGGHGMIPTDTEQDAYWTEVLESVAGPVAISVHLYSGYRPRKEYLRQLKERFPHIVAVNVMGGQSPAYLMQIRDEMPEEVETYTGIANAVQGFALGCSGVLEAESNVIPHLCSLITKCWREGDVQELSEAVQNVQRFSNIVNRWAPSTARWVKMALRVLGLPGGGLRPPYLMPEENELVQMRTAFDQMKLPELESQAVTA